MMAPTAADSPALIGARLDHAVVAGLRAIVLFDADRRALTMVAGALAARVAAVTASEVRWLWLGADTEEDDLWLRPHLVRSGEGLSVQPRHGALAPGAAGTSIPLVVVPDLVRLNLSGARGLVSVVDADVAHLERHGTSLTWKPGGWWLAGVEREAVGRISPHLLDRFSVRLDAPPPAVVDQRLDDLRRWVDDADAGDAYVSLDPDRLRAAATGTAQLSDHGLERVLAYFPVPAPRREIALARLAVAGARLAGATTAGADEVEAAAELIGVTPPAGRGRQAARPPSSEGPHEGAAEESASGGPAALEPVAGPPGNVPGERLVAESGPATALGAAEVDAAPLPYPEDDALSGHEFQPLGEGAMRARRGSVPRGTIVGTQRTSTAHDLAIFPTLLAAVQWQPYRRLLGATGLRVMPADLRRYRRAPSADRLLALLVDHTCLENWNWGALRPYLAWAYVERAEVCLVRVGADDARVETRADRMLARNLLDPRLDEALSAGAGRATPLAHGLQLALDTLRHKLQHGQGVVQEARLVVVTDGRGNVPLALDPHLDVPAPVHGSGVDDAVAVAREISALPRVERIVLDPDPLLHRHLLEQLAEALGAGIVRAERLEATA